jgi:hypothetical protein
MKRRTFLGATLAAVSVAFSATSLSLRAAAAQLVAALKPRRRGILLPPLPRWNPKTDDIDCADFFRRMQDYERTFLPRDIVFPRAGQIWEAVRDCTVYCFGRMGGPERLFTWPDAQIRQGQRVRILISDPKPLTVTFAPVPGEDMGQGITPDNFRPALWLRVACTVPFPGEAVGYFHELFKLVQEAA